jgi:Transglutaminase-like superfamily
MLQRLSPYLLAKIGGCLSFGSENPSDRKSITNKSTILWDFYQQNAHKRYQPRQLFELRMLNLIAQKFLSFERLPIHTKIWFAPTWLALGAAQIVILCIPFRHLARSLGVHRGLSPIVPLLSSDNENKALGISKVIQLAARHTPWHSNCFSQAIVARLLLGFHRVPCALYFGVKKDREEGGLNAHAWVCAGPVNVSGGASFSEFTVVAVFVSHGLGDLWE